MHRGELMDRVLRSTLRPVERLMVLAYVSHLPSTLPSGEPAPVTHGRAWPGRDRLAAMCGCGLTSAKKARARLVELGVLVAAGEVRQCPAFRLEPECLPMAAEPLSSGGGAAGASAERGAPCSATSAAAAPDPQRISRTGGGREATGSRGDRVARRPGGGREAAGRGSRGGREGVARRPRTLSSEPSPVNPLQEPSPRGRAGGAALDLSGLPPMGPSVPATLVSADVLEVLRAWHRPWAERMAPTGDRGPGDEERVVAPSEIKATVAALRVLPVADLVAALGMVHAARDGRPAWLRRTGQPLRVVLKRDSLHDLLQALRRWQASGACEPGAAPGPPRRLAGDLSDVLGELEVDRSLDGEPSGASTAAPLPSNVVPLAARGGR